MREVLQQLIATEEEARGIVTAAHQTGDKLVQEAQAKAAQLLEHARAETRLEAERVLQSAMASTMAEERELLARADAEIESELKVDPGKRQCAVRAVVQCVFGQSPGVQEGQDGASACA